MTDQDDRPATGSGGTDDGGELTARGYRHTPGNEQGTEGTALNPSAGGRNLTGQSAAGSDAGGEDAFGADPGGRERFDAANAYGTDVDPNEMGGLDLPGIAGGGAPGPGGGGDAGDAGDPGSGTVGSRSPNQQEASAGGAGAGMSGQGGAPTSGQ